MFFSPTIFHHYWVKNIFSTFFFSLIKRAKSNYLNNKRFNRIENRTIYFFFFFSFFNEGCLKKHLKEIRNFYTFKSQHKILYKLKKIIYLLEINDQWVLKCFLYKNLPVNIFFKINFLWDPPKKKKNSKTKMKVITITWYQFEKLWQSAFWNFFEHRKT